LRFGPNAIKSCVALEITEQALFLKGVGKL